MTTSDYTKSVIAQACWWAAKDELHTVMLSVAQVFRNRARAGWFEGDVYENAARWLIENPPTRPADVRDPQFQQLLARLDVALTDLVPDKTGGALWFGPKNDDPIPESFEVTTTIGQLVFLKQR